jgi:hypothetical protein
MKTDRLTPPPSRQRQEDFACPPWTEAIEAVAEQSSAWPWQQPRPTSARQVLDTVPFAGRIP